MDGECAHFFYQQWFRLGLPFFITRHPSSLYMGGKALQWFPINMISLTMQLFYNMEAMVRYQNSKSSKRFKNQMPSYIYTCWEACLANSLSKSSILLLTEIEQDPSQYHIISSFVEQLHFWLWQNKQLDHLLSASDFGPTLHLHLKWISKSIGLWKEISALKVLHLIEVHAEPARTQLSKGL